MHELQTREFKNADPCVAPDTDALLEQKLHSLDTFDRWWFDQLKEGALWVWTGDLWSDKRTAYEVKEFREQFEEFEKKQKGTYRTMTQEELGKRLHRVVPGMVKRQVRKPYGRIYEYVLPRLSECRAAFEQIIGQNIVW